MDLDPSSKERGMANLRRIADALGRPIESFYQSSLVGEEAERLELLLLWDRISNSQGRRRLLSLARKEAEREGHLDDT